MKRIAVLGLLAALTGCDVGYELTIDNQGTSTALVLVGYWVYTGSTYDPDSESYETTGYWVNDTFRVPAGTRFTREFAASVEINIYRESDMTPLFHDTSVRDETITVYP